MHGVRLKKLILELLKDEDIREVIGEALVELPREYGPVGVKRMVYDADTSDIPEYRPIRPEDKS